MTRPRLGHRFFPASLGRAFCPILYEASHLSMLLEPRGVGFARFNIAEHSADRVRALHRCINLRNFPCTRRRNAHDSLVCLDLDDLLIGGNFVARLDFN